MSLPSKEKAISKFMLYDISTLIIRFILAGYLFFVLRMLRVEVLRVLG